MRERLGDVFSVSQVIFTEDQIHEHVVDTVSPARGAAASKP